MGDARSYVKQVWDQKSVVAIYPAGMPIKIGDVLSFQRGKATVHFNLKDRGVRLPILLDPTGNPWEAHSEDGVSIQAKLRGSMPEGLVTEVLGKADAGAVVKMQGKSTFVLSLANVKFNRLQDIETLNAPLRRMFLSFGASAWDTSWRVVTEVGQASSGTVLLSSSSTTQLEFKAGANVNVQGVQLTDLSIGFKLVNSHNGSDQFTVATKFTPICSVVKLGFFGVHPTRPTVLRELDAAVPAGRSITEAMGWADDSLVANVENITTVDDLVA